MIHEFDVIRTRVFIDELHLRLKKVIVNVNLFHIYIYVLRKYVISKVAFKKKYFILKKDVCTVN